MKRALRIVLGIEVALGVVWTLLAAMAQGAGGLAVVGVFFVVYGLCGLFFLFAAWAFWRYPQERKTAAAILLLPVVFWFLPTILRALAGGVLRSDQLVPLLFGLLLVAIGACWVVPRRVSRVVPDVLLHSRLLNWLILLAVIGGWLFLSFVIVYVASGDSSSAASSGTALAYAIILAAMYLVALGVGSFGASTWAWLSLRSGAVTRRLNIAQLVVSLPGVAIGLAVVIWLAGQGRL